MEMENEIDDLLDVQKIINQNSDKSVMVLDSWNKIVFVNPVFEKMTGFSLQEIKGFNPLSVGLGENMPDEFMVLMDTVSNGEVYNGTFKNQKKNGEVYFSDTTIIPIYKEPRKIIYYVAVSSVKE